MDRIWYDWVTWDPPTRLTVAIETDRGEETSFVVSYDYRLHGAWTRVAQFDHNPDSPAGHDITVEGLHLDLYRGEQKYRVVRATFPYVPVNHAARYCIEYVKRNHGALIERFERLHSVNHRP